MPTNPKKYQRGTSVKAWGCPRGTPSSLAEIRLPFNTLYFYCFINYTFFLERLYFSFLFCLVLFAAINGWTPTNFFWRSCLAFHLPRTLRFSLLSFNECSLFLLLRLVFIFALIFVQIFLYLYIKVHFGLYSMLVFIKRVVLKRFEWCEKREKVSCKKWYKKELV
jgi:hypothetical protein